MLNHPGLLLDDLALILGGRPADIRIGITIAKLTTV
jgi:hypothetical protein